MVKYHISKGTNLPSVCHATVKACPLGGTHYDSMAAASTAADLKKFEADLSGSDGWSTVNAISSKADKDSLRDSLANSGFDVADPALLKQRRRARSTSASDEEILEYSNSKDVITRISVATNQLISAELLTKLSQDKDWGVRAAVAKNAGTPQSVLETLLKDENFLVVSKVRENRSFL